MPVRPRRCLRPRAGDGWGQEFTCHPPPLLFGKKSLSDKEANQTWFAPRQNCPKPSRPNGGYFILPLRGWVIAFKNASWFWFQLSVEEGESLHQPRRPNHRLHEERIRTLKSSLWCYKWRPEDGINKFKWPYTHDQGISSRICSVRKEISFHSSRVSLT